MLRGLFDLLKTNYLIVYDRIWGVLVTAVKESEQRNVTVKKADVCSAASEGFMGDNSEFWPSQGV